MKNEKMKLVNSTSNSYLFQLRFGLQTTNAQKVQARSRGKG